MHQVPGTSAARAVPPQQDSIYTAPSDSGEVVLGRTLVSLLDEACEHHDNPQAFNQRAEGWTALSSREFRAQAEALALGLADLGLQRGDRVALYMHSDVSFCVGDMACLLAGLVDAPIYLTHTPEAVKHILNETESRVLLCSSETLLKDIVALLPETCVETVALWAAPTGDVDLPNGVELRTFDALIAAGKAAEDGVERLELLRAQLRADDVATLIYTSGTTGMPKGVMLTHENISSNAIAAMTGLKAFRYGPDGETALSFLPLTHIFARTLHYCLMWVGASVYFSTPGHVARRPERGQADFLRLGAARARESVRTHPGDRGEFDGCETAAVRLVARTRRPLRRRAGAERLVRAATRRGRTGSLFSKWREALGGEIRQIIVGGAALRASLVNTFGAAGITVLQGYGLTETSPVVAYNRPRPQQGRARSARRWRASKSSSARTTKSSPAAPT